MSERLERVTANACKCGALACAGRGEGMTGEPGWFVEADCGNRVFSASLDRNNMIREWNRCHRFIDCPYAKAAPEPSTETAARTKETADAR